METLLDPLASYIDALDAGLAATTNANARPVYTRHLAAAARIASAVLLDRPGDVRRLIEDEQRAHGWGFLGGPEGERSNGAFVRLTDALARLGPA